MYTEDAYLSVCVVTLSNSKNQFRNRFPCVTPGKSTLPNRHEATGSRRGDGVQSGDDKRGIEIFPDLGDHPINSHSPSMHPRHSLGCADSFNYHNVPEHCDGRRSEREFDSITPACQHVHHVLVFRWSMEPPLYVRIEQSLHGFHITDIQSIVKGKDRLLVTFLPRFKI